jgi:fatty-acid peroxygenase
MTIPKDPALDNTLALFHSDGYEFISRRCRELRSDVFATRLMFKDVVCMMGREAAEQFYWPGRFTRRNALPLAILSLIQDVGSVMTADSEDHRGRKQMFLSLMTPESLARIGTLTLKHWRAALRRWERMERVKLLHQAHIAMCAAICEWAGLLLTPEMIEHRATEFEGMVDGTGSFGPRNWRGHLLRSRSEDWLREVIQSIRDGRLKVPPGSAASVISFFHDANGQLLDVKSAAVELNNVLRPAVANARYSVFVAMALHHHPEWRERLAASDSDLDIFADEVRRYYPLIPAVGGRVLEPFTWRGHHFRKNDWVMFDLYGTNHDPRIWGDPEVFRPARFREQAFGPYDLVSHGAGDRRLTHRCPGEWITVEQIKTTAQVLTREMTYEVPAQDLTIDLSRIPAVPNSRFILTHVREQLEPLARAS